MTAIIPTREDLEIFIYERHKDAYGVKGRHYDFEDYTYEELEAEAIRIDEAAVEAISYERKCDAQAVIEFRAGIRTVRGICGCDRATAIRYMIEEFKGEYDAGYICYSMNLPYSMTRYIEPALRELNDNAPAEEFVEKYDDVMEAA
jgi:hypothetical protein